MPRAVVHARPALLLATAYTRMRTGHASSLPALLGEAETLLAHGNGNVAISDALRGELYILSLATLTAFDRDPPRAHSSSRAVRSS